MSADPQSQIDEARIVQYRAPDIHRLLPQAGEAEKGVISSFFLSPGYVGDLCIESSLTPEYFHIESHREIFRALMEFHQENEPIDHVTITQYLKDKGKLERVGGMTAIADLMDFLPTAANASHYIEIVREKFVLRKIIEVCTNCAARGYEEDDPQRVLSDAIDGMLKLVGLQQGQRIHTRDMRELVMRAMDRIEARLSGEWTIRMPTGIKALDEATMGFKAPQVTAICAKPSDGKSSLLMNIVENLALNHNFKVGIISLDDNDDQVTDRLIQALSGVSRWDIEKSGKLTDWDRDKITAAARRIGSAWDRIFIRDDGALTPSEISATFAMWQAKHGLDIGIIDHIQLARAERGQGRTEEAEGISRTLKPMAKRFGIPLIVASQVSVDKDGNYSTKNSKALIEDANNVWAIGRVKDSTDAWINISKQKDGPRDISVPVKYLAHCTRFTDRDKGEPDQPALINTPSTKKKK